MLETRGLCKSFGALEVARSIDFRLEAGARHRGQHRVQRQVQPPEPALGARAPEAFQDRAPGEAVQRGLDARVRRAQHVVALAAALAVIEDGRHLRAVGAHEDVAGLEVAMNDAPLMRVCANATCAGISPRPGRLSK